MATERFKNFAQTTLSALVTSSSPEIEVTDPSGFPSESQFRIKIDSEILLVTALSGDLWQVDRAQEGTTVANGLQHGFQIAQGQLISPDE